MKRIISIALVICWVCFCYAQQYKTIEVDAPFKMDPIPEYIYPNKQFPITKYGAKADGKTKCTKAIAKAIDACNKAGGGHVIVPEGTWITGAIHFKSNVDLHLEKGAVLYFTDDIKDYLPAVMTTWEGMECYNYSPLLYALECENIAITGPGKLLSKMDFWKTWFTRPQSHIDATLRLYNWGASDTPVEQRNIANTECRMRPHLIQFNRCKNILLDGFQVQDSPFWTIHMYHSDNGIVRNLNVSAHGHNNDGIDIDMSSNFLVENCTFDQGDDAVVIKSGRNRDAWRLAKPTENVVIRNCHIKEGHTLLGIGSELSGGIHNIYLHDCIVDHVNNIYYVKTNQRRGAVVDGIWMKNIHAQRAQAILGVATNILYQWASFPDYEIKITEIKNLHIENVSCDTIDKRVIFIEGDPRLPVRHVEMKNIHVGKVLGTYFDLKNVEDIIF